MTINRSNSVMFDDALNPSVMLSVGIGRRKLVSCIIANGQVQCIKVCDKEDEELLNRIKSTMPERGKGSYIWKFITNVLLEGISSGNIYDGAPYGNKAKITRRDQPKEVI